MVLSSEWHHLWSLHCCRFVWCSRKRSAAAASSSSSSSRRDENVLCVIAIASRGGCDWEVLQTRWVATTTRHMVVAILLHNLSQFAVRNRWRRSCFVDYHHVVRRCCCKYLPLPSRNLLQGSLSLLRRRWLLMLLLVNLEFACSERCKLFERRVIVFKSG